MQTSTDLKYLLFVLYLLSGTPLSGKVLDIQIVHRDTVLQGRSWGAIGAYEMLQGTVVFGTDPLDNANAAICDLQFATPNDQGLILSTADLIVLKPVDQSKSTTALVEVSNRGSKFTPSYFLNGAGRDLDPANPEIFGDGLLLKLGVTIIWVGWQFDVPESDDLINFFTPKAKYPEGSPILGKVRSDWTVDHETQVLDLGHNGQVAYPAYDLSSGYHILTARSSRYGKRDTIDRSLWSFGRLDDTGQFLSDPRSIYMKDGFGEGKIFELVYLALDPPVVGLGLAAIRDIISYAKYDESCPFPVKFGIAAGVSQTGRFLRYFNYRGFNVDEEARIAYDGMMIITAGAGRGSFNHRFAQPSRDAHRYSAFFYPTDIYPFTSRVLADTVTGKQEGLLGNLDKRYQPKIFLVNTGYEYWGRAASLIHTDLEGKQDVLPLPNERIYHIAGAQHFVNSFPPEKWNDSMATGNPLEFRPNYRALFTHLFAWVTANESPPPNRYPLIAKRELVLPGNVNYPKIPSFIPASEPQVAHRVDYGPEWSGLGIVENQPPKLGEGYPTMVPQVDSLGNEIGGIINAELAVPLASYVPYSLRTNMVGGNGEIANFRGTFIPLPLETSQDDSRPSISEMYKGKADYLTKVRLHLETLVEAGFILDDDIHRLLVRSSQYWNYLLKDEHTPSENEVDIMSFNIRYDNPGDGPSQWKHRKDNVNEVITEYTPDFFGLQEALHHQLKDVFRGIKGYKWIGVGRDDGKNKGEFSPIFYNKKKWKVLDEGTFWLSETPDLVSVGWDASMERIATWGKFEHRLSGEIIFVFNTHFDHRGREARLNSAKLLRKKIEALAGRFPYLLSGDFNFSPQSKSYLTFTKVDTDSQVMDAKLLSLRDPEGPNGTFSGFEVQSVLPRDQIDYLFCSHRMHCMKFLTIIKSKNGRYPSDHFPVFASFRF